MIYAGEIVESGTVHDVFKKQMHPYTEGLFSSIPNIHEHVERLVPIPGLMPDPRHCRRGVRSASAARMPRSAANKSTRHLSCGRGNRQTSGAVLPLRREGGTGVSQKELLRVEHLKKYFQTPRGTLSAVEDVSFRIEERQTWASWARAAAARLRFCG